MNRVVEYIIRAKDATGAAIKSAKAKLSSLTKHAESEFSKFAGGIKKGLGPLTAISSAFGMMEGTAGKAARAVSAVASAAMAFGPLGAVVAGAQAIISHFASKAMEEADRILEKARKMQEQVEKRSAQIKASILEGLAGALSKASSEADKLLHKFDRLAQKRAGLQKAELGMFSAQGEAKILEMQRQMEMDVAANGDDTKGVARAAWSLEIAKERAAIAKKEAEYRAVMEAESIRNEEERIRLAERAAKRYDKEANAASERYDQARELLGKDDDYTKSLARQRDAALEKAEAERSKAQDIRARLEVARAEQVVNEKNAENANADLQNRILEAENGLLQAEDEYYRRMEEEERKRAELEEEAERERVASEQRLHDMKMRNMRTEIDEQIRANDAAESSAMSRLSAAQAAVAKAWGWYKDKNSMQAEIDAYKQQKEAEIQWEKDFEKLKDKRRDWRTVEFGKLSAEEEAVRQVALAKEEERAAQVALDEIAENTAYLKEIAESLQSDEGA